MADSFGRITNHLVDALEITPPALLPTVLSFWVPPPLHHAGEAAHIEFDSEANPKSGRLIISGWGGFTPLEREAAVDGDTLRFVE